MENGSECESFNGRFRDDCRPSCYTFQIYFDFERSLGIFGYNFLRPYSTLKEALIVIESKWWKHNIIVFVTCGLWHGRASGAYSISRFGDYKLDTDHGAPMGA